MLGFGKLQLLMDFKTQTIEVILLQCIFGLNVRRLLLIIIF